MNPKKSPLWNIAKDISVRYHKEISNFNRVKDGKFVEDKDELCEVGKSMFDAFFENKPLVETMKPYNLFVDICSAPGYYSQMLLNKFPESKGVGISLPPEKGGVEFEKELPRYKIIYKDILEKEYKLELPKKLDFGMASCVSYIDDPNKSFTFTSSNYKENYRHKLTKKSDISYVMFCLKQKYESMK